MLASRRGLLTRCTPTVCCLSSSSTCLSLLRSFRSDAALEALQLLQKRRRCDDNDDGGIGAVVLYNYPSFSGALGALFAHLYHSSLKHPFLVLPFSSVVPFAAHDFNNLPIHTCYLLDFVGPATFALHLSSFIPRVIAFDHRTSTACRMKSEFSSCPGNLQLHIDTHKSSSRAVYNYFSQKLLSSSSLDESTFSLFSEEEDRIRVEGLLQYIEDVDLRNWSLPCAEAFHIGIRDERSKLNCLTNPSMFHLLMKLDPDLLIAKGNSLTCSRQEAAKKLLGKTFRIRLGRGLYGECLFYCKHVDYYRNPEVYAQKHCHHHQVPGIRTDGNSNLSHEIGIELSKLSAEAGLRAIGAVVFMKHGILKVCLRSTDDGINTAEIAKAYGGGGKPGASSFVMTMDEYNHWILRSC